MPAVHIPSLLRELTRGQSVVEVDGATVRQVIASLEQAFPGLGDRLLDGGRLRANISVAIDGEIRPLGLLEEVGPDSEIHFVAAIKGGCGGESNTNGFRCGAAAGPRRWPESPAPFRRAD
ncbi:MAG: MoaD/ThiS family protein [Bryobacterales bacterium]|nr:MoaD/ThiS family protein [Bryobacterales bacterium]